MKPRILFIVPSDYNQIIKKKVSHLITERDENGFFERVVTVHPHATQDKIIDINDTHRIYEFKEFYLPFVGKVKLFRYLHHPFYFLKISLKIVSLIKEEKINVIRATDPLYTGILGWIGSKWAKIPFCISIHADNDKRFELDPDQGFSLFGSRKLAFMLEKFSLRRANLILPIRESIAKKIIEKGFSQKKIRVIPHGIDMEPFRKSQSNSIRKELSIPKEMPILSFVGRMSKDNYVEDLLRLILGLQKTKAQFYFVFAGDGVESDHIKQFIASYHLEANAIFLGFKSREFVISLRKVSLVSYCLMGGFSLIEACAAGSAVVAYDVEWHSEIIKSGETGYLVPENDLEQLLRVTQNLLDHPSKARTLGQNAKKLVFERHDIRHTKKIKQAVYKEILGLN